MCGIFGIWNRDGRAVDLASLRAGTDAIRHRGPDDEGYLLVNSRSGVVAACGGADSDPRLGLPDLDEYAGLDFDLALGFRRLSILDLSPAGHQPMASADGRFWIVFNGEIYNYRELRGELEGRGHSFRSGTDTEVILAAYSQWGSECLGRFNGMWAFAIWDNQERQLFLARDRMGIKPLFIVDQPGTAFAFASEIKALISSGCVPFRPVANALSRFIAFGSFPDHRSGDTFFDGVTSLPPACRCSVKVNRSERQLYWQLPRQERAHKSDAKIAEEFGELLSDAIHLRLRSDVPVGTCLSGGLDSSAIVALVRERMLAEGIASLGQLGQRQRTFSAVHDIEGVWNERRHIDIVARHTGVDAHFVVPTAAGLWPELESIVWHQDEPAQSAAIYAHWCVMRLARSSGVTVLLDGQGADEVLTGYTPQTTVVQDRLRRLQWFGALQDAWAIQRVTGQHWPTLLWRAGRELAAGQCSGLARRLGLRRTKSRWLCQRIAASGLSPAAAEALTSDSHGTLAWAAEQPVGNLDALQRYLTVEHSLPNLLRYEDRSSMAFSVEARVPFLDYRLVEFAFRHAAHLRFRDGWTKHLLRSFVDGRLPDSITWRRDKVGYDVPEHAWLRCHERDIAELFAPGSRAADYIDRQYVVRALPELLGGPRPRMSRLVWRWINTAIWLDRFSQASRVGGIVGRASVSRSLPCSPKVA